MAPLFISDLENKLFVFTYLKEIHSALKQKKKKKKEMER